jgi:hypothetical protein
MDDDIRRAFASLSGQLSEISRDGKQATDLARESLKVSNELSAEFKGIKDDVASLKTAVFGSTPPAPPAKGDQPLVQKVSSSGLEVAALQGQLIAVTSELTKVKETNETQNEEIGQVKDKVNLIYKAVTGFFINPKVIMAGRVIFTALFVYALSKGWIKK